MYLTVHEHPPTFDRGSHLEEGRKWGPGKLLSSSASRKALSNAVPLVPVPADPLLMNSEFCTNDERHSRIPASQCQEDEEVEEEAGAPSGIVHNEQKQERPA